MRGPRRNSACALRGGCPGICRNQVASKIRGGRAERSSPASCFGWISKGGSDACVARDMVDATSPARSTDRAYVIAGVAQRAADGDGTAACVLDGRAHGDRRAYVHGAIHAVSEPVVFLSSRGDERGPSLTGDADAPPPQLRGRVLLTLPRPARIKDIVLTLTGVVRTDWPEGTPQTRLCAYTGIGQNRIEMAEQVPILRLKTSIFRSQQGTPIALDRVPEATQPEQTPLPGPQVPGNGAVLTRLDDIWREKHHDVHTALAARGQPSARKKQLKGLLDGLRISGRPGVPDHEVAAGGPGAAEWFELRKGTYEYPFSMSLPIDLPATLHADFGHLEYLLKANVYRSGTLTPNLSTQREVTLVQMPDAEASAAADAIIVSRTCEDMLSYMLAISGSSFPIGTHIPVSLKMVPMNKIKIHRITVALEEQTDYYAHERRTMRREVPRKWTMLRLNGDGERPLLPVLSEASDPLAASPLQPYVAAAAAQNPALADGILVAPLDPNGPWELAMDLGVSMAQQKKVNISCQHPKSNITVQHLLKITIRVERGTPEHEAADAKRRVVDIVIGVPITLTHSHTSLEWVSLPSYESAQSQPPAHTLLPPVHVVHTPLPPATDFVYTCALDGEPVTTPAEEPPSFHFATSPAARP